mgnify:CR=1 FL=1
MGLDWKLVNWPGKYKKDYHPLDRYNNTFTWIYKGELELRLVLALNPSYSDFDDWLEEKNPAQPYFQLERHFRHASELSQPMVEDWEIKYALEDIRELKMYCQPIYASPYLEEFEIFFRESLLPLPENYMEAWEHLYKNKYLPGS